MNYVNIMLGMTVDHLSVTKVITFDATPIFPYFLSTMMLILGPLVMQQRILTGIPNKTLCG